jgi:2-polyprenyl-3-methyl-5-hydroxy-6-metoxy-1,4-benzoquinol methylase
MKTFSKEPGLEKAKTILCPVCGLAQTRPQWQYESFSFVRCRGCGLVYQNPQPIPNDLAVRYDEEYFAYEIQNEDSFYRLAKLGLGDIGFDGSVAALTGERRSILDVGCATGRLLAGFKADGWQVQGVEICKPAAEYGIEHHGVPIHIGTLETGNFRDGSFGVVNCSHVIEHLADPAAFVGEARRILTPGGWLVITTPNIAGFQARLMGRQWRSAIADHVSLFSKRTLARLLKNGGFAVQRTKTWGGIGVGITSDLVKKPLDVMAKRLGFGDVMIVLAQAPSVN